MYHKSKGKNILVTLRYQLLSFSCLSEYVRCDRVTCISTDLTFLLILLDQNATYAQDGLIVANTTAPISTGANFFFFDFLRKQQQKAGQNRHFWQFFNNLGWLEFENRPAHKLHSVPYERIFVHFRTSVRGDNSNKSHILAQTEKRRRVGKVVPQCHPIWSLST